MDVFGLLGGPVGPRWSSTPCRSARHWPTTRTSRRTADTVLAVRGMGPCACRAMPEAGNLPLPRKALEVDVNETSAWLRPPKPLLGRPSPQPVVLACGRWNGSPPSRKRHGDHGCAGGRAGTLKLFPARVHAGRAARSAAGAPGASGSHRRHQRGFRTQADHRRCGGKGEAPSRRTPKGHPAWRPRVGRRLMPARRWDGEDGGHPRSLQRGTTIEGTAPEQVERPAVG